MRRPEWNIINDLNDLVSSAAELLELQTVGRCTRAEHKSFVAVADPKNIPTEITA